ncbi:hypothetical protein ACIBCD_25705 [Nocardia brasiliensis]|uniref:hypothetical protein n=1 Tax=Nocardia brasiliensis TaxID=37326 RepID=UPI002457F3D9|nr:hypothetical protein [Nocardia brasiliensis]
MRIRTVVAGVATALGLAVLGATTAGEAAAIVPEFDPGVGLYGALDLNGAETAALRNSPIPGMLDGLWMDRGLIDADPASQLSGAHTGEDIDANFSDVVAEAAARGGTVSIGIVDPVRFYEGNIYPSQVNRNFLVVQFL